MSQQVNIPQTTEEWAAWRVDVEASLVQSRDAIVSRMGFKSYDAYRASRLWKRIRKRVMVRDGGRCFRCGGPANEVHHDSYAERVMRGEDDSALFPLCEGCHDVVEFDDDGRSRSQTEKHAVLQAKDSRTGYPKPKVDLRRDHCFPPHPPEWKRMNAVQRAGWSAEHGWFWYARKHPDKVAAQPERFAEQIARFGMPSPPRHRNLR